MMLLSLCIGHTLDIVLQICNAVFVSILGCEVDQYKGSVAI